MNDKKPADIYMFEAIVTTLIIASFVYFIYMLGSAPTDNFSAIYVKPDSYDNYLFNKRLDIIYGIQNNESLDMNYTIAFFADNILIKKSTIFVQKGKFKEFKESLLFGKNITTPFKLRAFLNKPNQKDADDRPTVFVWIKSDKKETGI